MYYGKLMAVALVGGAVLVGCGNKDDMANKPTRNTDGTPMAGATDAAKDMQKKDASDKAVGTEMGQMKDKAADAASNAKDMMKNGADAAKDKMNGMMGTTTQPAMPK